MSVVTLPKICWVEKFKDYSETVPSSSALIIQVFKEPLPEEQRQRETNQQQPQQQQQQQHHSGNTTFVEIDHIAQIMHHDV